VSSRSKLPCFKLIPLPHVGGVCSWGECGCGQSVTADYYEEQHRGKAFGTLHLTSAAGAALGGLYATNMGKPMYTRTCCICLSMGASPAFAKALHASGSLRWLKAVRWWCCRISVIHSWLGGLEAGIFDLGLHQHGHRHCKLLSLERSSQV
jgi:MFS family permease